MLLFVAGKDVERGLGFQAANNPEAVAFAAADQVVGEDAGVVVAARDYVKAQPGLWGPRRMPGAGAVG